MMVKHKCGLTNAFLEAGCELICPLESILACTRIGYRFDISNQLVPLVPYHEDGYYTDGIYEEDYNQPLMIMSTGRGRTLDAFA